MMVKRPSVGAAGFVLDHYDRAATENHLHAVGDVLLSAFGDQPPDAVFQRQPRGLRIGLESRVAEGV